MNEDGFASALANQGLNKTNHFNEGYFSVNMGETALCLDGNYYILNSDYTSKFEAQLKKSDKLGDIKAFWLKESESGDISDWSDDFDELKQQQRRQYGKNT